jgi:hypothetical protein
MNAAWSKLTRNIKEGDDTLVTLFVGALVVAVIIAAWIVAPHNGDSLLPMVPRSSVAYAHAAGEGLERFGEFLPPALVSRPAGVEEAAAFALLNGDEMRWSFLLRFSEAGADNRLSLPCRDEVPAPLCLVTEDDATVGRVIAADSEAASLWGEASVRRALARARARSLVQAYVQPASLKSVSWGDVLPSEPSVMTWRPEGTVSVVSVSGRGQWPAASPDEAPILPPWAVLVVRGHDEVMTPALAAAIADSSPEKVTDYAILDSVIRLLARADFLAVSDSGQGRLFAAHLKGVRADRIAESLVAYLASRSPVIRSLDLPDGGEAVERVIDDSRLSFSGESSDYRQLVSSRPEEAVPPLVLRTDRCGTWLASGPAQLPSSGESCVSGFYGDRAACFRFSDADVTGRLEKLLLGREMTCFVEFADKSLLIIKK